MLWEDISSSPCLIYEHACRLLSISPRSHIASLLPPTAQFSTHHHSISDHQAVALSAAILVSHSASWPLIRRFLRTYVQITSPQALSSFDLLALSPFANAHPNQTCVQNPLQRRHASTTQTHFMRFGGNHALTSNGAAAVIAAVMLIPQPIVVDLSFARCPGVSDLTLSPWVDLIETERGRTVGERACSTLTSLYLDACPIRTLDPHVFSLLSHLSFISLRATAVSNLWRTVEGLNSFPSLRAALFAGSLGETQQWNNTQHWLSSTATSHQSSSHPQIHPHSTRTFPQHSPPGHLPSLTSSRTLSKNPQMLSNTQHSKHIHPLSMDDSPSNLPQTNTTGFASSTDIAFSHMRDTTYSHLPPTRVTPITKSPYYRAFLLATTKSTFKMLDGIEISEAERENARRLIARNFENPPICAPRSRSDSAVTRPTLLSVLRSRELEMCTRGNSRAAKASREHLRPRKKRRTQPNFMTAIAAAGIPLSGNSSVMREQRLSPAAGITVALAATSTANVHHSSENDILRKLRLVRDAVLSIQPASEQERLESLFSRSKLKHMHDLPSFTTRRKVHQIGLSVNREDEFAAGLSAALVARRGKPRVQYLCQGNDRPRQFEYNPGNPSQLVYGTEYGYLVVMDEPSGVVQGSCRSGGGPGPRRPGDRICRTPSFDEWAGKNQKRMQMNSAEEGKPVYGLSWLNRSNGRFISGTGSGGIHVYDVGRIVDKQDGGCTYACDTFRGLTSISVNSNDSKFAASGKPLNVGLFDLETGRCVETMTGIHAESINVIKFAHQSPHVLVTSSFDRYVKKWDLRESRPGGSRRPIFATKSATDNVMVCLSPDDTRLLVSAVDNEVRQYSACDGSLEIEFEIPKTGLDYNFTRSYYMNNRDYIITGSAMENVVRVFNARTGSFFTEVDMDDRRSVRSRQYNVLSLRANPARKFTFSTLLSTPDESFNELMATVDMFSR